VSEKLFSMGVAPHMSMVDEENEASKSLMLTMGLKLQCKVHKLVLNKIFL